MNRNQNVQPYQAFNPITEPIVKGDTYQDGYDKCNQEWIEKIEKIIRSGSVYQETLNSYTEVEKNRICIALKEILGALLPVKNKL